MDLTFHDLFKFSDNSSATKGFAWASGYRPVPGRKSFIHPALQERSDAFFRINPMDPGIHIDDTGYRWPDFLGCGCGNVDFFVSERVLASLDNHRIEHLDATEYPIASIASKRLRGVPPPRYFVLEADPELVPDWKRVGVPMGANGQPILTPLPKPWPPLFWAHKQESWSGRDLAAEQNQSTRIFGSVRLGWIAKGDRWTNLRVEGAGRFPEHSRHRSKPPSAG